MKKSLSIICIVLILSMCIPLVASAEGFDHSVFNSKANYEYDKFEGTWSYYEAYVEKYNDAKVVIGIEIDGEEDKILHSLNSFL